MIEQSKSVWRAQNEADAWLAEVLPDNAPRYRKGNKPKPEEILVRFVHLNASKEDGEYNPPPTYITRQGDAVQCWVRLCDLIASKPVSFIFQMYKEMQAMKLWLDFDLLYHENNIYRHVVEDVQRVVKFLQEELVRMGSGPRQLMCVYSRKAEPYEKRPGQWAFGFHLIFPFLLLEYETRRELIKRLGGRARACSLSIGTQSIGDPSVLDATASGQTVYGTTKG